MSQRDRGKTVEIAALRAGMSRKTATKYLSSGKLPSETRSPRHWRTRDDPFDEDWPRMTEMLAAAPELEAKALFEYLMEETGRYQPGQLRTFQRRVRQWQALNGPDKEVFFPQQHRPGEAAQTDFTSGNKLGVTIAGEVFDHLLCVVALPYSNWSWATVCRSESMAALRHGVQDALFRLGKRPEWHQTDNSTAATHDVGSGKRKFNDDYVKLMDHLGLKPRTIAVGESEQNGDVEALNGAYKRRVKQHLLLRGSADFESVDVYQAWLDGVSSKANALRADKLEEELAVMEPLRCRRLPEWTEEDVTVTSWSTIRVKHNAYSVPSRLIGEELRVRVYDDRIEAWYGGVHQLTTERLHGRNGHRIDYRHIIWWLVRKPAAFARYRYREDLFPTVCFRRAYDALCEHRSARDAELTYLRILHLSASTLQDEVETALNCMHESKQVPDYDAVKALVVIEQPSVPDMPAFEPELSTYDEHLEAVR